MLVRTRCALLASLVALGSGCRGWRGDTYYAPLTAKEQPTYRFGTPGEPWQPLSSAALREFKDVQVAWIYPAAVGLIDIRGQCEEQGDSSLQQYTDHLRIDWTQWKILQQQETTIAGRAALRTVVEGKLDGVPRRSEFVVVKKNGCLFDLRYSTEPSAFERNRPEFEKVVQGFTFPVSEE